jgi:predicted DNA-binding protein
MGDTKKMTAFRLSEKLLKRLDAHARQLSAATGLPATRADVVRLLLEQGLDDAEMAPDPRRKK